MVDPCSPFWNEEVETRPHDEAVRLQDAVLKRRLEKAYAESPLYRRLFDAHGIAPAAFRGRDDLAAFPLSWKDDVRAYRDETGDPFGGVAGPLQPASVISRSSGTTGVPTFQASSSADLEAIAESWATIMWGMGARPGSIIAGAGGVGTRAQISSQRAAERIGATWLLADLANLAIYARQIQYLQPDIVMVYPTFIERLSAAATEMGTDIRTLFAPVRHVWWSGKRLMPRLRHQIQELLDVETHELNGMGDIGFYAMDCSAGEGAHLRDDYFVMEILDPATLEPQPLDTPGEIVLTSLWDEGMNHIRWRSEDLGKVLTAPCSCGRTTSRIVSYGRVWERTELEGRLLMPADIEDALLTVTRREVAFQIVRTPGRPPFVRVALAPEDDADRLRGAVAEVLSVDVALEPTPLEEILAGAPAAKYRQVVDLAG